MLKESKNPISSPSSPVPAQARAGRSTCACPRGPSKCVTRQAASPANGQAQKRSSPEPDRRPPRAGSAFRAGPPASGARRDPDTGWADPDPDREQAEVVVVVSVESTAVPRTPSARAIAAGPEELAGFDRQAHVRPATSARSRRRRGPRRTSGGEVSVSSVRLPLGGGARRRRVRFPSMESRVKNARFPVRQKRGNRSPASLKRHRRCRSRTPASRSP